MTAAPVRVGLPWLGLRETADAAARASDLVDQIRRYLPGGSRTVIHDLGCGTGSMGRWLAPQLTGTQHWILYDRDAELLAYTAADLPAVAADGGAVSIETRQRDITRLDPGDLAGASLITASAVLDMMTAEELERFVLSCAHASCPALVTLSVVGRVELTPADPLDERFAGAFNAHQRRTTGGRRLLGPDAVGAAVDAFARLGADVLVRPSPWRLGAAQAALTVEWFTGWVGAACEQQPELIAVAAAYAGRRLAEAAAGRLNVMVDHQDLLARPR
ncbi:MAG: class I SAM-dependent methyltransferase [Actinomycetota bacterium]|nr:class I SAM-dependent methyltransferase [Actinomycetota bacterium]